MHKDQESSPWLAVKLHTLFKLTPRAYGTVQETFPADIPAVSTWRAKGSIAKHEDPTADTEGVGFTKDVVAAAAAATSDGAVNVTPVSSTSDDTANGSPVAT